MRVYHAFLMGMAWLSGASAATAQARIGIGTDAPQQMLSIAEGINVDQGNANRNALLHGIRFGSNSNTGIASNRGNDQNNTLINNLMFFTNNQTRMLIDRDGRVGIGSIIYARLNIGADARYDQPDYGGRSHLQFHGLGTGTPQYLVMGSDNLNKLSFLRAEVAAPFVNNPSLLMLQPRGKVSIGEILDPTYKLEVAGDMRLTGNILVRGEKSVLFSNDGVHLMRQIKPITVSATFNPFETKFIDFTWPVPYSDVPDCYVGNISSGSGGWAECVLSVALITATGGRLYIFNPRNVSFSPEFTVKIMAFGPPVVN